MQRIYLDNAATTALDPDVLDAMLPYLLQHPGNPSSAHSIGREARLAVETARKSVAVQLGAKANEIFFTSSGTESNNMVIASAIRDLHVAHIITSPIEHHAVLHTIEQYARQYNVTFSFVQLDETGHVELRDLKRQLLDCNQRVLVSLMHANNEIGNLLDIEAVGNLCRRYNALFHSDCVQTVGHYPIDLSQLYVNFISASAHKFHGPKGSGLLYVHQNNPIKSLIYGGAQERGLRAGTENVAGIVGFAKALELSMSHAPYIRELKAYLVAKLEGVRFNGDPSGLYTVLNVGFPKRMENILFELDLKGICVSGGSACSSGESQSHVLRQLPHTDETVNVRFSFSKFNTAAEIVQVAQTIKAIYG